MTFSTAGTSTSQVLLLDAMDTECMELMKNALTEIGIQLAFSERVCKASVGVCTIVKDPSTGKVTLKFLLLPEAFSGREFLVAIAKLQPMQPFTQCSSQDQASALAALLRTLKQKGKPGICYDIHFLSKGFANFMDFQKRLQEAESMGASVFFNAITSDEPTADNQEAALAFAAFSTQAAENANVTALQTPYGNPLRMRRA
eukprot:jgi/Botrbrau1/18096/Bobra.0738s0001.1